jgi:hypothetical protein
MLSIRYDDGEIVVRAGGQTWRITTLTQVYLVQDRLQWYREQCSSEQEAHMYAAALDLLRSAKDNLIRYHEAKLCTRNWSLTPASGPSILS